MLAYQSEKHVHQCWQKAVIVILILQLHEIALTNQVNSVSYINRAHDSLWKILSISNKLHKQINNSCYNTHTLHNTYLSLIIDDNPFHNASGTLTTYLYSPVMTSDIHTSVITDPIVWCSKVVRRFYHVFKTILVTWYDIVDIDDSFT